jgi:membrane-associated protease RseP (regulator of RpoE activity)
MICKQVFTAIGSGAIGMALMALPGASAQRQGGPATARAQSQAPEAEVEMLPTCEQEEPVQVLDCTPDGDQGQNKVRVALDSALASIGDDDNLQVVLGPHSSWLGVGVTEVNSEKVKELKLPAERGALLGKVVPDSPAAKAGLKENDVVTEINGQRVEGAEQFRRMIREIPAGRTAQFTIWRDGHSETLTATLGKSDQHQLSFSDRPGSFAFHLPEVAPMPSFSGLGDFAFSFLGQPRLGIDAEDLEGEFGYFFGVPDGEGILVRGVFEDSPAAKGGLKVGDVITSLNGERIRTIGELREKMVANKEPKAVKLGVLRNKSALTLTVELPAPRKPQEHHSSLRSDI